MQDEHELIFLVQDFPGAKKEELIDGYKVIRISNKWTVYKEAKKYYQKHLRGWSDLVIEEINTIPFLLNIM